MFLIGHMNWNEQQISNAISKDPECFWQGVPLNEYWEYNQTNPIPFRKYLNSGFKKSSNTSSVAIAKTKLSVSVYANLTLLP